MTRTASFPSLNTNTRALAAPVPTRRRLQVALGGFAVAGALLASSTAFDAWAAPAAPASSSAAASAAQPGHRHDGAGHRGKAEGHRHGHARGHGHGHGHGDFMGHGFLSGRGLDRLLDDVKATEAQRTQIRRINEAVRADLKKLHEGAPDLHQQSLALLTQPQVDAAAVERLRQQMLARHDAASKRMTEAMVQVAQVLTPEQRATLATKLQERKARWEQRRAERQQGAPAKPGEAQAGPR